MDNPLNSIILIMMLPYLMQMLQGLGGGSGQQQAPPGYHYSPGGIVPGPQPQPGFGYGYGPGQVRPQVVLLDPSNKYFPQAGPLIR